MPARYRGPARKQPAKKKQPTGQRAPAQAAGTSTAGGTRPADPARGPQLAQRPHGGGAGGAPARALGFVKRHPVGTALAGGAVGGALLAPRIFSPAGPVGGTDADGDSPAGNIGEFFGEALLGVFSGALQGAGFSEEDAQAVSTLMVIGGVVVAGVILIKKARS